MEKIDKPPTMIGRFLRKRSEPFFLENEDSINLKDFFSTSGLFEHIDPHTFEWFSEKSESTEKFVNAYSSIRKVSEKDVVDDASVAEVYSTLTLAHLRKIFLKLYLEEETLGEIGSIICFLQDKNEHLCIARIFFGDKGYNLLVYKYSPRSKWGVDDIFFF